MRRCRGFWTFGLAMFAGLCATSADAAAPEESQIDPADAATAPAPPSSDQPPADEPALTREPPRLDGTYLGVVLFGHATLTRVSDLDTDGALSGAGLTIRAGQMVLPWFGIGIQVGGAFGSRSEQGARQSLGQGGLLVDFQFVPSQRYPFSLRASAGFGGGAVSEEGESGRAGFGGAMFAAAVRYDFFPGVKRYRATRGGGLGLGPEVGWIGATPSAAGRPMANLFYLGLGVHFNFGS